jgi:hypothetical protein
MILNIWVKYMNKKTNKLVKGIITLLVVIVSIIGFYYYSKNEDCSHKISYEISDIPEYNGKIYIEINNNVPEFSNEDFNIEEDYYSELKNGKVRNGNDKN